MTRDEFKAALGELNLPQTASGTQALLGLRWRQIAYICAGRSPVPASVASVLGLLLMLQARGVPPATALVELGVHIPPTRRAAARGKNRLDVVKGNILGAGEEKS